MEKYSRSATNRFSNDLGHQLEDLIILGCKVYRQKGIADIDKTPEPFRVLSKNRDGTFKARFTGKAQPDFAGTLQDGLSIVFEAKATRTEQLKQNVISDEQWKRLEQHWRLGAAAGVVCQIKKVYGFVPWEIWRDMKLHVGRKHLKQDDLKSYEVRTPGYIDFLPGDVQLFRIEKLREDESYENTTTEKR